MSNRGKEVMIVNEWEIFRIKNCGKIIIIPYQSTYANRKPSHDKATTMLAASNQHDCRI